MLALVRPSSFVSSFAFLLSISLFIAAPADAQIPTHSPSRPRISGVINESSQVTLHGNTHPLAQRRFDQGPAPASMPAGRLLLVLSRSTQQEADLKTYLQSVQDANSSNYRKFLSPEGFGERFGVGESDLQSIQTWLGGGGFTVNKVSKGRMAVEFSGTVGQVQTAFHTSLHSYMINGVEQWANATDPQVPSALAPVIAGFATLDSFRPEAQFIRGPGGTYDAKQHRITPMYTGGSATSGYYIYLGPADAATIYNTPNALNVNHVGSIFDGTGVTIGIAGDSNIDLAQNANYRSTFGLPAKATTVVVDGIDPGENGDAIEAYLDTQVAGGIAPNANVILYTASNAYFQSGLFLAIIRALDENQADILNVSFGSCEAGSSISRNQFVSNLWEQAAAQGITVTVSSGDSGSALCDNPSVVQFASHGLGVNALASTPYNIAVGGTDFDILYSNPPSSFTSYVDTANAPSTHRSALGYIPEEPWNDSTYPNTSLSKNTPISFFPRSNRSDNIAAGSGGFSILYPVPAWQASFATGTGRNLPDVSLLAGDGLYGALWGLCTNLNHDNNGNPVADCAAGATGDNFNLTGVGGTSASAPAFAGMLALIKQKTGSRLGQADYAIYSLANSQYGNVFHDVTVGNNSVLCGKDTPQCALTDSSAYYFMTGYDASSGYDRASGLGSVDATELANHWASASFIPTDSSLLLNGAASALSITHGQSVAVNATVAGASGIPEGDIALVDDLIPAIRPNSESITGFTLTGGTVSGTTTTLPGGSYKVSAHYGGNNTYAASDSNEVAVTVGAESSSTSVKVSAYYDPATGKRSATPYYGFIYLIDALPYGNSASPAKPNVAAAGTITFKNGTALLGAAPLTSEGIAELETTTLPGGNNNLTAEFPGDTSLQASTSAPYPFTVVPAVTTLSVPIASLSQVTGGTPVTMNVTLSSNSAGAAPTGTVTFQSGSTTLGTSQLVGTASTRIGPAGGTAAFSTTSLPAGTDSVSAVYSGDGNYGSSTSPPVSVTVLPAIPSLTIDGTSVTVVRGATSGNTSTIALTPGGGLTGSVALTAAVTSSPTNAQYSPSLSFGTTSPVGITGANAATATLTITTTDATTAALAHPIRPGVPWYAAGSAALACVLLFGIPARRRNWRVILGMVVLLVAFSGGVLSCGGGGGNSVPGTTAGAYIITVTGTSGTTTATGTFVLTVR